MSREDGKGGPSAPRWGRGDSDTPLPLADPVPKPTVKAKVIRDEPALCKVALECSVGLEGVTYEWIPPRKLLLNGSGGSEQLVSFNPSTETYICKVSNPVSSNYASLTYKHPCSWIGITPHRHGAHRRWQNSGGVGCEGGLGFGGCPEQRWWP